MEDEYIIIVYLDYDTLGRSIYLGLVNEGVSLSILFVNLCFSSGQSLLLSLISGNHGALATLVKRVRVVA